MLSLVGVCPTTRRVMTLQGYFKFLLLKVELLPWSPKTWVWGVHLRERLMISELVQNPVLVWWKHEACLAPRTPSQRRRRRLEMRVHVIHQAQFAQRVGVSVNTSDMSHFHTYLKGPFTLGGPNIDAWWSDFCLCPRLECDYFFCLAQWGGRESQLRDRWRFRVSCVPVDIKHKHAASRDRNTQKRSQLDV